MQGQIAGCIEAGNGETFPGQGEAPQQCDEEKAALQQELVELTRQLERWKSDHSWTLEQLAKGREKEKAQMEDQLR
jgi:hypothetical protein